MDKLRRERGAAAVEFALILPLLLVLVLGIVEFGRVYHVQTSLSLAAREGVRTMALQDSVTAAEAAAQGAASSLNTANMQISVQTSNALDPSKCSVIATAITPNATVTINYPMTLLTTFFGPSITLKGKAVMRCNG